MHGRATLEGLPEELRNPRCRFRYPLQSWDNTDFPPQGILGLETLVRVCRDLAGDLVASRPKVIAAIWPTPPTTQNFLGVGVENTERGVLITRVQPGSLPNKRGLNKGMSC